jgi:hypothetical protein
MAEATTPTFDKICLEGNRFEDSGLNVSNNKLICKDGFTLSVISGWRTSSDPEIPPFTRVEVLVQSYLKMPKSWREFKVGGIYAFVPTWMVRELIIAHGGEA